MRLCRLPAGSSPGSTFHKSFKFLRVEFFFLLGRQSGVLKSDIAFSASIENALWVGGTKNPIRDKLLVVRTGIAERAGGGLFQWETLSFTNYLKRLSKSSAQGGASMGPTAPTLVSFHAFFRRSPESKFPVQTFP